MDKKKPFVNPVFAAANKRREERNVSQSAAQPVELKYDPILARAYAEFNSMTLPTGRLH